MTDVIGVSEIHGYTLIHEASERRTKSEIFPIDLRVSVTCLTSSVNSSGANRNAVISNTWHISGAIRILAQIYSSPRLRKSRRRTTSSVSVWPHPFCTIQRVPGRRALSAGTIRVLRIVTRLVCNQGDARVVVTRRWLLPCGKSILIQHVAHFPCMFLFSHVLGGCPLIHK